MKKQLKIIGVMIAICLGYLTKKFLIGIKAMTRKHQHSQGDRYEYQKLSFWMKPENQFWNSGLYSESSKKYFDNWLAEWIKKERNLCKLHRNELY